jgi:hypothetical protein
MWHLIGALVVLGLSANEPSALLVVLVVLRSGRNRGALFIGGWVSALVLVVAGGGFVARLGLGPRRGGPRRLTLQIELVIGIGLLIWAAWYWIHTRQRSASVAVPKHLARLTSLGRPAAFVAGLLTCTYPPAVVAGTTLLRSDSSMSWRVAGFATFVIIGTLMVAVPVMSSYVAPTWASARSDAVFNWMLQHRRNLLIVILTVLGAFISARAILHLAHHPHR